MLFLLPNFITKIMKVFMDDFTVPGDSFDNYFHHLTLVVKLFLATNLVLNFKKIMVEYGIVPGHEVSSKGLGIDKVKVDIIQSLLYHNVLRR